MTTKNLNITEFIEERRKVLEFKQVINDSSIDDEQRLLFDMKMYGIRPEDVIIDFDPDAIEMACNVVKRPVYRIVGKPLEEIETAKLLSKIDLRFSEGTELELQNRFATNQVMQSNNNLQDNKHFKVVLENGEWVERAIDLESDVYSVSWFENKDEGDIKHPDQDGCGWLKITGEIFENDILQVRYPSVIELLRYWILINAFTDKLDLIVAVSSCDERIEPEEVDFSEVISYGFHVQGNHIQIHGTKIMTSLYKIYIYLSLQ